MTLSKVQTLFRLLQHPRNCHFSKTNSILTVNKISSFIKLQQNRVHMKMSGKWSFVYPEVQRDTSMACTQFGHETIDPYRWLEDSNSKETAKFVDQQNHVSTPYIEACGVRKKIQTRLNGLLNYPRYGCPMKHGNNYFININSGLQNQSVMFIMRGHIAAEPEVFFDPNTLSTDGTVALAQYKFSHDGKYFAYALAKSGSDWNSIKIMEVDTGKIFNEEISRVKFSGIAWTHDAKGIFYSAYPATGDGTETEECINQKLYYHRLDTPQANDVLVYESSDNPTHRFRAQLSFCGRFLYVFTNKSCEYNLIHFHKFDSSTEPKIEGKLTFVPVVNEFNADYHYVGNDDSIHYIRTNRKASNFRLVKIDFSSPENFEESKWTDLIAEHQKDVLETVAMARQDLFICEYIRDVTGHIQLHKIDGSFIKELAIPMGSVNSIFARRSLNEMFYTFASFLSPGKVFYLELDQALSHNTILFKESKLPGFDSSNFVTSQVVYASKDGTKIPMFIVHKKGFRRDGNAPCVLYGYGGFNISVLPSFSPQRIILMQNLNGVFALANIRGGGEYGEKWHNAGKLENKQNCFDDFIAAAEFLVSNNYTNSSKLAIQGGSNGGLLVAACSNQRPDLFGAAIAQVGVMDMLRFHKFTIGHAWMSDYGNPDDEKDFKNLIKFSPYHNVPSAANLTRFPATLLLTAQHDDRVVPLHTFKLISELQYKLGDKFKQTPLLARIETKAGHGAGKPISKMIDEMADIYSFLINSLELKYTEEVESK